MRKLKIQEQMIIDGYMAGLNGLVDEYPLFINPIAIGGGTSIFKELDHNLNLTLGKPTAFESSPIISSTQPHFT
jgi:hypothetical protein